MLTNSNEPWIIPATRIARTPMIVPGNVIKRSSDSRYGIEYSYSFWCYVNDLSIYKKGEYKHIFHKGGHGKYYDQRDVYGLKNGQPLLQFPGVWFDRNSNVLIINNNTFGNDGNDILETCEITNIPVNKWFHIVVVLINKNLDVYMNGRLIKRCQLDGVPKENYGDLYVTLWGGFDGFLSKFRYFNYALPYYMVEQMFNNGPSNKPCIETGATPPYFANDVWFRNNRYLN